MTVVAMHIDKFGGVVKINDDHPLAIAQRAKDAAKASAAGGGDPNLAPPSEDELRAAMPEASPDKPLHVGNIGRLTVAELATLCFERGIEVPEGATRKQLIALHRQGS